MLVRHLSFFVALARERHFARAAEACNVAQPTLSAAIRKLEEDFEARLVIRGRHFVGLTPEGERVLAWGRQILTDYNSLREDLSSLRQGMVGTLRLGVIPAAMPAASFLTTRFCKDHPAADIEIQSLNSRAIQRALDAFELDAGLTYLENEPLGKVRSIPLYNESYLLLTSPDGMFGDRDQVTWKEVGQVPLCLLTPDMQNRRIIDRALKAAGAEATPTLTSNSIIVLYTHVKTGRWASVMPARLAQTLGLSDTVRTIPIVDPTVTYSVGLVVPQRDPLTPLIAALAQIAREVAPTLEP
jgi:DNA-binding transcriptional LysR family regulator